MAVTVPHVCDRTVSASEPLDSLRHRGIITGHGSAQRNDLIEAEVPREPLPSPLLAPRCADPQALPDGFGSPARAARSWSIE